MLGSGGTLRPGGHVEICARGMMTCFSAVMCYIGDDSIVEKSRLDELPAMPTMRSSD